jgi:hypothetical protein
LDFLPPKIVLVLGCFPVVPAKLLPLASLPSLFFLLAVRLGLRSPTDDEDDDDDDEDDWGCLSLEDDDGSHLFDSATPELLQLLNSCPFCRKQE